MPSKKDLCCWKMKTLRAEIDRRARNLPSARAFEGRGCGPFAGTPTPELICTLRGRQRAIYGTDDRQDIYQVTNAEPLALVDSVAALVEATNPRATSTGRLRLTTSSYKDEYELCDGRNVRHPAARLLQHRIFPRSRRIATTGHCVPSTISTRRTRFIDRDRARTESAMRDSMKARRSSRVKRPSVTIGRWLSSIARHRRHAAARARVRQDHGRARRLSSSAIRRPSRKVCRCR